MRLGKFITPFAIGITLTVGATSAVLAKSTKQDNADTVAVANEQYCNDDDCKAQMRNLIQLARNGSGRAAAIVALAYASGDGLEQDEELAERFIKMGVRYRDPIATNMLSNWHKVGFVVDKDAEKAEKYLDRAVKYGYAPAMYRKAVSNLNTTDTDKIAEGVELLQKAADEKLNSAMFMLARLKQTGTAVPKDLEGAGQLYKSLVRSRHPQASDYLKQVVNELADTSNNTALIEDFRNVKDVEVIAVSGQRFELDLMIDGLVEKLNTTGKYDSRSIGSRIRGVSCAEAAYCNTISPNADGQGASTLTELVSGSR